MSAVVPVNKARQRLGKLIQEAYYKGRPFVLTRNDKPMAALIGSKEFSRFIELLEEHDHGLADTLAIMSSPEIQETLKQGEKNIAEGKVHSFDESLLQD